MTGAQFAAVTVVMAIGSALQGSIGFGLALFAAPLLALIDGRLAPGPLLIGNLALTALMARREWRAVRVPDLGWSLGGRLIGIAVAVAIMRGLSQQGMDLFFGGLVLTGVAITALGLRFPLSPPTLVGAGLASGIMGTATAIGGPPMAIVYQHAGGPTFRGTLSAYFTIGAVLSAAGLALVNRFGLRDLALGLALCPGVALGFMASHRLIGHVDAKGVRPAVLAVSGISTAVLIVRHYI
ncbi:MAG: sulfite exporter TauE/SafE family protein [Gemmatimonadetes bacterium]|nr:sulfite exporter TauE/SafE family protein [Gemmatimonadota bacterium]